MNNSKSGKLEFLFGMLPVDINVWQISGHESCPACGGIMHRHPSLENIFACRNRTCLSIFGSFKNDSEKSEKIQALFGPRKISDGQFVGM